MTNQFVVNRLKQKPETYSVEIAHLVVNGEWVMGVTVKDVADDNAEQRERVAADLRRAADMIENNTNL